MDGRNVWMVERGEDFRFTLKAREPVRIRGKRRRQQFQRDIALEARVACAIDLL
jgi:hypothetical protein